MTVEYFKKHLLNNLRGNEWFINKLSTYYCIAEDYEHFKKIGSLKSIDYFHGPVTKFEIENAIVELFDDKIYVDRGDKMNFDEILDEITKDANVLELSFKSKENSELTYLVNFNLVGSHTEITFPESSVQR